MHAKSINHSIHRELLTSDLHYANLVRQKQELEEELSDEMKHAAVDWDGVKILKRRKLTINEQLEDYRRNKGAMH
jgi:hypothetical protein